MTVLTLDNDLPEGWAGQMMVTSNSDIVETWAYESIYNPGHNIIIKNYGHNLCKVQVRKRYDYELVLLRWA